MNRLQTVTEVPSSKSKKVEQSKPKFADGSVKFLNPPSTYN